LCPDTGRQGFTHVELIVVIVILGILAAIAVPARTGYIEKSEDQKYIMQARDRAVALHAALNEAYSDGDFNDPADQVALSEGVVPASYINLKAFNIRNLSASATGGGADGTTGGDYNAFNRDVAALLGEKAITSSSAQNYWELLFFGPKTADTTALNAEAFIHILYPEGQGAGKPMVYVTYRISHLSGTSSTTLWSDLQNNGVYDANAGYEVYHTTMG
jgi:prepilin-type N-terminal cleavage/methylation domain-containing protein